MKVCALSGRHTQHGRNIRNQHSVGWKFRAPRTNRTFEVNLQTVRVPVEGGGTKKIKVSARMMTSPRFIAMMSGQKPLTKKEAKAL
ncbi:MAG: bL28 family ribosomal protein [Capsulimonadales bacterium]|nr:bL28 family ribosomal protein [Capsulimonadales bacterium]